MRRLIPYFLLAFIFTLSWQSKAQYCEGGPSSTFDSNVEEVLITGEDGTEIDYEGCPGVTGVEDQTELSVHLLAGQTYTVSITFGTCGGNFGGAGQAWIDFNQNESFENDDESLGTSSGTPNSAPWNNPVEFTFTVPLTAEPGETRMRVMQQEAGSTPLDPCGTFTWGSVVDFTVNIESPEFDCQFPTAIVADVLSDSAIDLSWEGGGESEWNVEYGTPDFEPGEGEELGSFTVTDTELSITGLDANTTYKFSIQAVCEDENSFWNSTTASTQCGVESTPFVEDFDGSSWVPGTTFANDNMQINDCWENDEPVTGFFWGTRSGTTNSFGTGPDDDFNGGGNYVFLRTNSGTAGATAFIQSPPIDLGNLDDPAITFYYHMFGAAMGTLSLEVKTTSASEWDEIFSISGQQQSSGTAPWAETVVSLEDFADNVIEFRFVGERGATFSGHMAVDNVIIDEAPTCFNITGFDVSGAITTATATWNESPTATEGYIVEVYEAGQEVGVDTPVFSEIAESDETELEITGLEEGNDYVATIQGDCGDEDGLSDIIATNFSTNSAGDTCEAAIEITSLPFFTEDDTSNYNNFYSGSPGSSGCGTTSPYLNDFDVVYSYTPTEDQSVLVTLEPIVGTWSGIFVYESCSNIGSECIAGEANSLVSTRQFELSLEGGQSYFFVISSWGIGANPSVEYEFEITEVLCGAVSGFEVSNLTGLGADLNWNTVAGAENYEWIIVDAGGDPENEDDITASGTTTDTSVTVDTLDDSTNYDAYVRSECGEDLFGNLTGPINFQTECLTEPVPTSNEDFSGATFNLNTAPGLPCWSEGNGAFPLDGTDFSPNIVNGSWGNQNYANDANNPNGNALYINLFGTGNDWALSQQIDLGDNEDDDLVVQFDRLVIPWTGTAQVTDMGSHEVHVVVSTDGGNTWNSDNIIKTYSGDGDDVPGIDGTDFVSLEGYSGVVKIAFYAIRVGTVPDLRFYVDNFRVLPAPSCFAPQSFTINEIGLDSAVANWELNEDATDGYILEVYNAGDTQGEDTPVFLDDNIDSETNSITIDGLEEGTSYEAYLFANCGDEDGISVSSERTFQTANLGDTCEAAIEITDLPFSTSDSTSGYSNNYSGNPGSECGTTSAHLNQNDVVYSYIAEDNGGLDITLTDIVGTYAGVFVYDSCGEIGNFCLDGEGLPFITGTQPDIELIEVPVEAGEEYYIVISHWFNTNIDYTLEVEFISCSRPSALDSQIVTAGEIELQWNGTGNETQWEVEYGFANSQLGDTENTRVLVDQESLLLDDLASSSDYRFWVRAVCDLDEEEYSAWVGPEAFRSPIIPVEIDTGESHNEVYCYGNNEFTEWLFVSVADPVEEDIKMTWNAGSVEDLPNSDDVLRIYDGFSEDGDLLWDTSVDGAVLAGLEFTSTTGAFYMLLTTDIVQSCQGGQGELPEEFDLIVSSPETTNTADFDRANFNYYPNPVKNVLTVDAASIMENIEIFDITGKRIKILKPNNTQIQINLENVPTGVYLMKVEINGNVENFKVVKD